MTSCGASSSGAEGDCKERRRRNSAYDLMTSGIPLAGSKRATWMMYFPRRELLA